ncbi:delta-like protein C [Lineus longissimus]|uniref:delta-like protein C n=1 Tax=Lineus longissimus TaxID=88925 RepID=UPI002B4E41BF
MKLTQVIFLALFGVLVTLATVSFAANCTTNPCKNGECKDDATVAAGYVCKCLKGYKGNNCTTEINECEVNHCKNNGTCLDAIGYYMCACTEYWKGENCTITTITPPCIPTPCLRGNCTALGKTDYKCDCGTFWRGKNCQIHDVSLVIMIVTIIVVCISVIVVLCNMCQDYRKRHPEQFVRKGAA